MVISRKQFFTITRKNVSNLYNKGGNCLQLPLGANPTDIGDKKTRSDLRSRKQNIKIVSQTA